MILTEKTERETYGWVYEPSSLPFSLLPIFIDDKLSDLITHLLNNLLFLFGSLLASDEFVFRDTPFG